MYKNMDCCTIFAILAAETNAADRRVEVVCREVEVD